MARRKKGKTQPKGWNILERNGRYTARIRIAGLAPTAKTKDTYDDAEQWATSMVEELRGQKTKHGARRDLTKLTVGDLNRAYLDEPDIKTQKSYGDTQRLLAWWTNKFGNILLIEFGDMQLREVARPMLMKGKRGNSTVNRYLSAFRSAWNWGRVTKYVMQDRAWPAKLMLTEPRGIVRFLSDAELARLLKAAEADPFIKIAVTVGIATGLRRSELLRLTWKDIDLKAGRATIYDTKNDEIKVSHLIPEAVEAIEALKKLPVVSLTHPFVRITVRKGKPKNVLNYYWRKVRKEAKLDSRFRFHDLRHCCGSYLAQKGASVLEIQEVLGHKSPEMAARYSHLNKGSAVTGHANIGAKLRGGK
jgi:integrase